MMEIEKKREKKKEQNFVCFPTEDIKKEKKNEIRNQCVKRERPEQAGDGGIDGGGVIFKVRKVMDGVRPSIILDKRKGRSKKKSKSKWCGIKVGPSLLSSRMRFFFLFDAATV